MNNPSTNPELHRQSCKLRAKDFKESRLRFLFIGFTRFGGRPLGKFFFGRLTGRLLKFLQFLPSGLGLSILFLGIEENAKQGKNGHVKTDCSQGTQKFVSRQFDHLQVNYNRKAC